MFLKFHDITASCSVETTRWKVFRPLTINHSPQRCPVEMQRGLSLDCKWGEWEGWSGVILVTTLRMSNNHHLEAAFSFQFLLLMLPDNCHPLLLTICPNCAGVSPSANLAAAPLSATDCHPQRVICPWLTVSLLQFTS